VDQDIPNRWYDIDLLLERSSFLSPDFKPDPMIKPFLLNVCHILVVGAGGLGCELLKDLALSGFRNIEVIDMDTIDLSNLNRQFLFREKDIGHSKAEVAAKFINDRVPGANVIAHNCKIQDKDEDFYRSFHIVIAGLDSIEARRWLNATLMNLVKLDENGTIVPGTNIPMIDGGTEGFKGQVRVILPKVTSCFECSVDTFPPQKKYPICTIANTPRLPEHCIEWASMHHWPEVRKAEKLNADDPEHIKWLFDTSMERANKFNIKGVTLRLVQGVTKNIIPAIASTNAIIAAACTLEALKLATTISSHLKTYMMYNGGFGLYSYTFEYQKKAECPICNSQVITYKVQPDILLGDFLENLSIERNFKSPSIRCNATSIYFSNPPVLEAATHANLDKCMSELVSDGDIFDISDPSMPNFFNLKLEIKFS